MNHLKKLFFTKSFCCLGKTLNNCFNCKYCRLSDDSTGGFDYAVLPGSINSMFRKLPVAVNLFYGDPMLQIENTVSILKNLEKDKHTGPVIIITKGDFRRFPKVDFDLDLHFAFSAFGIDSNLDGGSIKTFLSNLEEAERYKKYKYSIEFRPIVCGVNDSKESIDFVMKSAARYGLAVGYSGLQGKPAIAEEWKKEGLDLRPYPGYKFGHKKIISDEVEKIIQESAREHSVPVFRKTSCLMSYVHNLERDYNAHYFRPNEVGCKNCPMEKRCMDFHANLGNIKIPDGLIPFKHSVVYKENHICILKQKGICEFPTADCSKIKGHLIKIDEPITTSDVRVIKWLTGMTVDADFLENSYISESWEK